LRPRCALGLDCRFSPWSPWSTLALTAHADSRLGQAAEKQIDISIAPSTPAPGMRSYVASLLGLYLFSIRLAEVLMCMTMDRANVLRKELRALSTSLDGLSEHCEPVIRERIERWGDFATADVLGSGPSYGSAAYTAAKLVEAAGVHATAQDAEEFHHLNFFCARPESLPAIVFAPAQAVSARRTRELVGTLEQLGRPHLIVTDTPEFAPAANSLVIPTSDELFAPILQTVPGGLFSAYAAEQRGITHYRGHTGPWRGAQGAALVRNSPIDI
jgi:glutamine---fructose-6-phosphate transaminase (isomerizing)